MSVVNCDNIINLLQRTLNRVDSRLVDHGKQVGYLVSKMLDTLGGYSPRQRQDLCLLAMLHDIGAYKTDEIDKMVQFETENIWEHSVYGYLFLKKLSPLGDQAEAVLFHHAGASLLNTLASPCRREAQMINLADRINVFVVTESRDPERLRTHLAHFTGSRFDADIVALFWRAEEQCHLLDGLHRDVDFSEIVPQVMLSAGEIDAYLKMMIFAIDFRSRHTVTHTITTTQISDEVAIRMGIDEAGRTHIHYGALLHDLGKIGIPVDILESPDRLSGEEMRVMRTHVDITKEILDGTVDPVTTRISQRHHEKLDGSGYPQGLTGGELTLPERIVAVSDMASALCGVRSYKGAFSKEQVLEILWDQVHRGLLDGQVVGVFDRDFDEILRLVEARSEPIIRLCNDLYRDYEALMGQYAGRGRPRGQVMPSC